MEKNTGRIPTDNITNGREQVMLLFQDMMSKFLEIQKEVMLSYLGNAFFTVLGTDSRQPDNKVWKDLSPSSPPGAALASLEHKPGEEYQGRTDEKDISPPKEMEEITSVKEAKQERAESAVDTAIGETTTVKEAKPGREQIQEILLGIVSERTGYPREMLDLELDMEADLGIDSIKRVEILGSFQKEISSFYQVKDQEIEIEKLGEAKTLKGIIEGIM